MKQALHSWCRLCARENGNAVDLFLKNENDVTLLEIIEKFLQITINQSDDAPQKICQVCNHYLYQLLRFYDRCTKANALFAEILSDKSSNVIDTDYNILRYQYGLGQPFRTEDPITSNFTKPKRDFSNVTDHESQTESVEDVYSLMDQDATGSFEAVRIKQENNDMTVDLDPCRLQLIQRDHTKLEANVEMAVNPSSNIDQKIFFSNSDDEPLITKLKLRSSKGRNKKPKHTRKRSELGHKKDGVVRKCEECDKIYPTTFHYQRHIRSFHTEKSKEKFVCDKCPKEFSSLQKLRTHKITHLPPEERPSHPCPFCGKSFSKILNMKTHIRGVHGNERPFICEECGKAFVTKGALKEHQITHSEETPFQCSQCPKKFKNSARLKVHEDCHDSTNYVCPHCGLQLNTRRTLNNHLVVHSDVKQYKCNFCGNEYKRAKALKSHLILHTGLKPYACQFCDKTFANGSNCRSHKKKAHPNELAALEASGEASRTASIPRLEQLKAQSKLQAEAILRESQQQLTLDESQTVSSLNQNSQHTQKHSEQMPIEVQHRNTQQLRSPNNPYSQNNSRNSNYSDSQHDIDVQRQHQLLQHNILYQQMQSALQKQQ